MSSHRRKRGTGSSSSSSSSSKKMENYRKEVGFCLKDLSKIIQPYGLRYEHRESSGKEVTEKSISWSIVEEESTPRWRLFVFKVFLKKRENLYGRSWLCWKSSNIRISSDEVQKAKVSASEYEKKLMKRAQEKEMEKQMAEISKKQKRNANVRSYRRVTNIF